MAVPQNKISPARRDKRRSHHALSASNVIECPNCGELKRPHHICKACGFYRDREMVTLTKDIDLDDDDT